MKNKMTIASVIFTLLSLTGQAFAQNRMAETSAAERAQFLTKQMKETLMLDSAQVARVAAINLNYALKMDPVIKGNKGRLAKMRAYKEINASKEKDLQQVLTPEQFRQYQQWQEEMKEKIRKRRK